jgi:hypothetical protein
MTTQQKTTVARAMEKTPKRITRFRPSPNPAPLPRTHHLDRYADDLAAHIARGDPDELLYTPVVARVINTSPTWLEIGRVKGWGPPFVRLSSRVVRYRRRDVVEWLRSRASIYAGRR